MQAHTQPIPPDIQYVYIHSACILKGRSKLSAEDFVQLLSHPFVRNSAVKRLQIGTCSLFMFLSDTLASWTVTTRAQWDCLRPRSYCVITLHGPCFHPHGAHMPRGDGHFFPH